MRLNVNLEKRYVYVIIGLLILVAGCFAVYAYGTSNPSSFGHTTGEIDFSSVGNCSNICTDADTYVTSVDGLAGGTISSDLTVSGNINANAFYYSSDETLKKNIQPLSDSLEKILQLEGVSFQWKENDKESIGIIAQDLEKIFPRLVSTDKETYLKSVQYGNLVAPLIEAIKEQQKQIEELKTELELLKDEVQ
jgi:hypothetical protein